MDNTCTYLSGTDDEQCFITQAKETASQQRVFHLPFHPHSPAVCQDPTPRCQHVSEPSGKPPLHQLCNAEVVHIPVRQLIAAYHQHFYLHNVLSYRKLCQCKGLKVSSYLSNSRGK